MNREYLIFAYDQAKIRARWLMHETHLLLIGLLYQEDPNTEHATLDPIRLLLATFSVAWFFDVRATPIVIALILAHIIGRFLAALRDGTIKAKNDP